MPDQLPDEVLEQLRRGIAERQAKRASIKPGELSPEDEKAAEAYIDEQLKDQPGPIRWWIRRRVMRRFRDGRQGKVSR